MTYHGYSEEYGEYITKCENALNSLKVLIDNTLAEYKYHTGKKIDDHSNLRIKEFKSAKHKLEKKGIEITPKNLEENINDVVGFRLVCKYLDDVYTMVSLLKKLGRIKIVDERDYICNPKESGYRSYHLDVIIPIYFNGEEINIKGEIQIRTKLQDMWASVEHELCYKKTEELKNKYKDYFAELSSSFFEIDKNISKIKGFISEETSEFQQNQLFSLFGVDESIKELNDIVALEESKIDIEDADEYKGPVVKK